MVEKRCTVQLAPPDLIELPHQCESSTSVVCTERMSEPRAVPTVKAVPNIAAVFAGVVMAKCN